MEYKYLIASDMDYTLLMPGTECSEENKKAIKELKALGAAFTISTGRSAFMVGKYAKELSIDVPIITSNGGALYDYSKRNHIYSNDFSIKQTRELLEYFLNYPEFVDLTGYSTSGIYIRKNGKRNAFFDNYNSNCDFEDRIPLFDLDENILNLPDDKLPDFSKFLVIDGSDKLTRPLYLNEELEVCTSAPGFCDIMLKGQTKGNALLQLADYLDISRENLFACGDSENDKSMLLASKHRIAMDNATEEIKAIATYVTTDCKKHGIAHAIYDYIIPIITKNN